MSTAKPSDTVQYECCYSNCDETFSPGEAHGDGFHKPECYHKHLGEKRINQIENDPRFSAASFEQLREFHPRGRQKYSSSVVRDDNGTPVDYRHSIPDAARPWSSLTPQAQQNQQTMDCQSSAGTMHHSTEHSHRYTKSEVVECAANLSIAVEAFRREGKHDYQHDRETLLREVRGDLDSKTKFVDSGEVGVEYARALGKAIAEVQEHD